MALRGVKRRSNSQSRGLLRSARNDSFGPRISEGLLILNRHIFLLSIPTPRATRQSRRTCASDCHCHQAVPQCACAESKISDLPSATPQPSGNFLKRGSSPAKRWILQKSFPPGTICANFRFRILIPIPPSPSPLPRGERVLESPSLDGRGKGEGDNYLI